jgi:conjugal transfer pilus assembly protein TrbC
MNVRMLTAFIVLAWATPTTAQTMQEEILAEWKTYIVVSSAMPREQLVSLAHEAGIANAVIVLNGFPGGDTNLQSSQKMITEINEACCDKQNPSRWIIEPRISRRYHITAAPSFVIARGESTRNEDFSVITGDIDLANALKYMAQRSGSAEIRRVAATTYQRTFAAH